MVKNFSLPGYKTGAIVRGPWELIYIFDESTKYLYTFMRETNFANLHKGNMLDKLYHYSHILSRLNGKLLGTYEPEYEQMSFIDTVSITEDTDMKLEAMLQAMINTINDDIERYAIVLVDCNHGVVKQIECVIPVAYMSPLYREDWTEHIKAEYTTESYHVEETTLGDDAAKLYAMNSDINLSIRSDEVEIKEIK